MFYKCLFKIQYAFIKYYYMQCMELTTENKVREKAYSGYIVGMHCLC